MKAVKIPQSELYLSAASLKVKEKYLYYLWGTLLLGEKEDFELLYHFYKQDKNIYGLNVPLFGIKNKIWGFCVTTFVGRIIGRYILKYYKYFQRRSVLIR